MARPRRELTDDWSGVGAIVYGLRRGRGPIVYVGATRNPHRRFAYYRSPSNCHNDRLGAWLKKGPCSVDVLHEGMDGLFEAERKEIARRKNLMNLVGGGAQNWREHAQKPWMGGTGVLCPSAIMLRDMACSGDPRHAETKAKAYALRSEMTDIERCFYETNLARQMPQSRRLLTWLDATRDRMIRAIEAHYAEQNA